MVAMNAFTPSPEADSAPLPDAEVLYQQLCALLQPLRGPQTQLVGITSGGAWMARRLQHQWGLDHVGIISTALHRDDFAQRGLSRAEQTSLPFAVDGSHILLLDDVLSELDEGRKQYLLTCMKEKQTFVTSCDDTDFLKTDGEVYRMDGGVLNRV